MNTFFNRSLLVGILIGAIIGCNGSGSSTTSSGAVTQADLAALKAQLRVEVVQTAPFHVESDARYAGVNITEAPAATTASTTLGTSCGYDAPYPKTTQQCIVDSSGVSVVVPYPQGGSYQEIYPVYYSTQNCDDTSGGNAFIQRGTTTIASVPNSGAIVFRVDPFAKGALDTSTYYHIAAGTVDVQVTVQSEAQSDGNCIATSFGTPVGMLPITKGVTGSWPAGPTGPLASGTPQ